MVSKAILRTLAYSDLFDYPLTKEEIWRFLISEGSTLKNGHLASIKGSTLIVKKDGFYCFAERTGIINKRLIREKESRKKLELARKIISKLSIIPTIQFIAISGALAMKNSDKDDDIDLFVITKKNRLWITRLLLLFFLEILGHRRRRNDSDVTNKICLNMLIDEFVLCLPEERQDLYSAHEIVQMVPVYERDNTYEKFIKSNRWVEKYLSNFKRRTNQNHTQNYSESFFSVVLRNVLRFSAVEKLSKTVQLFLIRRHQTIETVSDKLLAFHPIDYKNKVLGAYKKRLKKYEI